MSDKPISVGDLVQVLYPSRCDGGDDGIGHTFTVRRIYQRIGGNCAYCDRHHPEVTTFAVDDDGLDAWATYRLKRIPPLSELETTRTEDEVTA